MESLVIVEIVSGVLFTVFMILFSLKTKTESWFYAFALLTLPTIYMGFGYFSSSEGVVLRELLYGLPIYVAGLIALFVNFRLAMIICASFWLIHGVYDLSHDWFFINDGVFSWYPMFCASVDAAMGAYLFFLAAKATKLQRASFL